MKRRILYNKENQKERGLDDGKNDLYEKRSNKKEL